MICDVEDIFLGIDRKLKEVSYNAHPSAVSLQIFYWTGNDSFMHFRLRDLWETAHNITKH